MDMDKVRKGEKRGGDESDVVAGLGGVNGQGLHTVGPLVSARGA